MKDLEKRVSAIEARNAKVASDKEWETSLIRKIILLITTYLLIGAYMQLMGINRPWGNAIIPSIGFLISTLTLQWAKNAWLKSRDR
ncbi:MAG: hypothetical protein HZB70_02530 [Candidatus Berkelbacteria bacterium]|nr:MAG: hypothetical protein HZB70_02530 [Candidatus Berkelbacteria bacterium]QQG51817.1 MAG: hypothetical protein HY845_00465 [Candidatus Berkelbacteria bacterium]